MRRHSPRSDSCLPGPRFKDPAIKPLSRWSGENRNFYADFRDWLWKGGYGPSALNLYGVAARIALGLLDKPYWMMDPQRDLDEIRAYIQTHYSSETTRASYLKGLAKLAEYLCLRNRQKLAPQTFNWDFYCAGFPAWLTDMLRRYLTHCRRAWPEEKQHERRRDLLSRLTAPLRRMVQQTTLNSLADITPRLWDDYLDYRLPDNLSPVTTNGMLTALQAFLRFQAEQGDPICPKMLQLKLLHESARLPRDVSLPHLRRLQTEIDCEITTANRRMGILDKAWFLVMLHSGLRTLEIRTLKLPDLDLETGRVYLEQSKGLKDRIVPLSRPAVQALRDYLAVRGPAATDHFFLFHHQPITRSYCQGRLKVYCRRGGLPNVTPHRLRHSCATLLLNAGAPVLTVQTILGHKHINTTLGYARLYDGTVAADYYRAMAQIEPQLSLTEEHTQPTVTPAHLLAMIDSLQNGTLNENQRELVNTLRLGIQTLTHRQVEMPEMPQEVVF